MAISSNPLFASYSVYARNASIENGHYCKITSCAKVQFRGARVIN